MRAVAARLARDSPELIVHELRELPEKLGVLVLVIVRDPAGYELCLVSSETSAPRRPSEATLALNSSQR